MYPFCRGPRTAQRGGGSGVLPLMPREWLAAPGGAMSGASLCGSVKGGVGGL